VHFPAANDTLIVAIANIPNVTTAFATDLIDISPSIRHLHGYNLSAIAVKRARSRIGERRYPGAQSSVRG
jgi:hypothetical protein